MRIRPVNQFDHRGFGGVTTAKAELRDPRVPTVTLGHEWRDRVEQLLQNTLVLDEAAHHATVVDVHARYRAGLLRTMSVPSAGDELFGEGAKLLGLGQRRHEPLVLEERRRHVRHKCSLMACRTLQFPA